MKTTFALNNSPNQTRKILVQGDTRSLNLFLRQSYNTIAKYWVIGIYDISRNPIVLNIPLFVGQDLFAQYQYLNIGSAYLVNTGDPSVIPDDAGIGNYELVWELV